MRLFPLKGIFGPVAVILSIQTIVLVGSLIITSDLMLPFARGPEKSSAALSNSSSYSQISASSDSAEFNNLTHAVRAESLFQLQEALSMEDQGDQNEVSAPVNFLRERDVEYIVKRGDTLAAVWANNGAPTLGATLAVKAVKDAGLDRFTFKKGESVYLSLNFKNDISRLTKRLNDGSTLIISGSSYDGYEASLVKPNIFEQKRSVVGTISSSFASAASEQGIPYEIIDDVVDLFSNRIEFSRAIQPGDSFTVTFNEKRCKETDKVLDTGPVLTASFKRGSKLYAAIRHQNSSGGFVYYDENGRQEGEYFLRYPVKFSRISSTFSWARFHPVLKKSRPHYGVDFAAPAGTPIRSIGDGTIEFLGYKSSPGNMIRIRHSERWSTVYMHLKGFAAGLRSGQRISRGQVIGYVGSTGLSTGAHLHFELWDNGRYVDPMAANLPSISAESAELPKGFLTAALKELELQHQKVQLAMAGPEKSRG